MNYFTQKKAYYRKLLVNPLSRDAQVLYNYLLDKDNELFWKKKFSVTNSEIMVFTGMSISALQRARNELKTKSYIEYEKKSGNNAGNYGIIEFVTQIEQQNGQQSEQQNEQQVGQQSEHIHNIEQETIYFNLLKNAREKFEVSTFGGKLKARTWASEQEEWGQLTDEERLMFTSNL